MPAKHTAKGRSKSGGSFVMLPLFMLQSQAWRELIPQERAVYIALAGLYRGTNNGYLALSVRDAAAECRVNKDTAARCFLRLEELGFIERAQEGAFSVKVRTAAEYRLTSYKCDRTGAVPSKGFMRWRPDLKHGPVSRDRLTPQTGQPALSYPRSVPPDRTVRAASGR